MDDDGGDSNDVDQVGDDGGVYINGGDKADSSDSLKKVDCGCGDDVNSRGGNSNDN